MRCRRCGFHNPHGFRFCGKCGASLGAVGMPLSKADLDHLRTYLPQTLIEALQFDLLSPSPRLLEQCVTPLRRLLGAICALLPARLVGYVIDRPEPGHTGGQFLDGTLLFADISGFTAMSEQFSRFGQEGAEEIITIVNRYFGSMLSILREHGGELVEFDGDAFLGLFAEPGGAAHAVQAAHRMQAAMADLTETQTSQGFFPLEIKVGLHTGRFFAAGLGTPQRMVYTLLGSDVTATAAVEAAAMAGQVLVDRQTLDAVDVPCKVTPSPQDEQYLVVERIDLYGTPSAVTVSPCDAVQPGSDLAGLRYLVDLLDAMVPYLPAGLLPHLVGDKQEEWEGEYRLVSVLFANVSGLGNVVDTLGPGRERDIVRVVNRYYVAMQEAVHRYGGSIGKMSLGVGGDKLLAFFGAPLAHEDDVERALRTALAMQDALGDLTQELSSETGIADLQLAQRIGVSYGYVIAGHVGTDWRREYTVMGDEVNLAERLATVAGPGEIIISGDVRKRVQALFDLEPQSEVALRGRIGAVPTFAVRGLRAGTGPQRGLPGMSSPLVGRQTEWDQLLAAADQLLEGQGQVVSIVGEAGLGKSRLIAELRGRVQESGARWVEGRCLSYTEAVSYWPFREALRRMLGMSPDDRGQEAGHKLRRALQDEPSLPDIGAVLPYLASFLGIPVEDWAQERTRYLDAEALQRRTFIAIGILFEVLTKSGAAPLILVLEDIHWIDQASLSLLEHLLPLVDRTPLMVLLTYRPDGLERCAQLRERLAQEFAHCATEVALDPLKPADSQLLLKNLVRVERWPAKVRDLILSRAEGNPLYLEETLRALIDDRTLVREGGRWRVDSSVERIRVPDTLQGVIMTRLDRLHESSRWTAQVASVIGRVFSYDVIEHIVPMGEAQLRQNLAQLQEHEIIRESHQAPHLVYVFNHALIQDVCYRSLLTRTRRLYHRRVAEYLARDRAGPEGTEGGYPFVAYHAFAGEQWSLALEYELLAGQHAQSLFANEAAIEHYRKALESADHLPRAEVQQHRRVIVAALGELLTDTGQYDEAQRYLEGARAMAAEAGDTEAEARACRWLARLCELRSEYDKAVEWIQEGLVVLGGRETAEMTHLLITAGLGNTRLGNYDTALDQCEISLRIAETLGEVGVLARGYLLLGHLCRLRGAGSMAVWYFQRGLDLYEIAGDVRGQARAHDMIATAHFYTGQWEEAEREYLHAREMCELIGNRYSLALADNNLGGIALNQGRLREALVFYQRALRMLEQLGESQYVQGALHVNLGHTFVRLGQAEPAYGHLRTAETCFEQAQARDWLPEMHRHLAEAAVLTDDLSRAEKEAQRALELARELAMRNEEGNSLRVLAEVATAREQYAQAKEYLGESITVLELAEDEYEWARSVLAMARLHLVQGEIQACARALGRCKPVLERLQARLEMSEIEALRADVARAGAAVEAHQG